MIELVRYIRTMNIFPTFENDARNIADLRALMMIFNMQSWKMHRQFVIMIKKTVLMLRLTYVSNVMDKNDPRNTKMGRLNKWSIIDIFNEAEPQ